MVSELRRIDKQLARMFDEVKNRYRSIGMQISDVEASRIIANYVKRARKRNNVRRK